MKVHPRLFEVSAAEAELQMEFIRIAQKHEITVIEALGILTRMAQQQAVYALRAERHPKDPAKRADEE